MQAVTELSADSLLKPVVTQAELVLGDGTYHQARRSSV
jgi:hypothetical protein